MANIKGSPKKVSTSRFPKKPPTGGGKTHTPTGKKSRRPIIGATPTSQLTNNTK